MRDSIEDAMLMTTEPHDTLHVSALRQIAKACRDFRRNANLDDSSDTRSFLEEIETQLEGVDI
jgi:hypothetical protein